MRSWYREIPAQLVSISVLLDTNILIYSAQLAFLIVAAALVAGCEKLLSEDMQHGRVIDGVRIENPFRELA